MIALLVGMVCGHLYDVYKLREHWPFSFYPMYAKLRAKDIQRRGVIQGTTTDLKINEFELTSAYIKASAEGLVAKFETDPQAVREQLRSLLRWNNRTAHDKANRTARLTSIALYEVTYDLSAEDDLRPPTKRFVTRVFIDGFKVKSRTTATSPATSESEELEEAK